MVFSTDFNGLFCLNNEGTVKFVKTIREYSSGQKSLFGSIVATLKHYVHNLYVHIRDNIIDPDDDIEAYGQRGRERETKLSERIQYAVEQGVKITIHDQRQTGTEDRDMILQSRYLYYSKVIHGDAMLRRIQPSNVAQRCTNYFAKAAREIAGL